MSRREDIDNAIWSDPDFLALTGHSKLVYLWSFTNPRCGMSGLYKVVGEAVVMETGLSTAKVRDALDELAQARFVFYDGRVMWVRSRVKHLRSKSPNIAKAIRRELDAIGEHRFARELAEKYVVVSWLQGVLEGFLKTLPNPSNPSNPLQGVQGMGMGMGREKDVTFSSPCTPSADEESPTAEAVSEKKRKPAPPDPDQLPDDLPDRLHPVVDEVQARLARVAAAKGASSPSRARVGRLVADFPKHAHGSVVADFEDYWTLGGGAGKPLRDIARAYRNRCDSVPPNPAGATVGALVAINGAAEDDAFARQQRLREARERQDRESGARWATGEDGAA